MIYSGSLPCVRRSDRTLRVPRPMVLRLKSQQEVARFLIAKLLGEPIEDPRSEWHGKMVVEKAE